MKRLILLALLATSTMSFTHISVQHSTFIHKHIQKYLPEWSHDDNAIITSAITLAAWAAKYTPYTFTTCDHNDPVIVYRVYNDDCCFTIKFNRYTRFCGIDFDVDDDSFDYDGFKKVINFFFDVD
jgi:hypothetical protein